MRRGALPVLGILGAALAVLVGCVPDDADPGPTTRPPTASPVETVTEPTPIESPTPSAAMDGTDEAGAIAAAEYFMGLYDYVYSTGDLTAWDAISGQTCVFCANVRDSVMEIYGSGGSFSRDAATTYSGFHVLGQDEQIGHFGVSLDYSLSSGVEVRADGTTDVSAADTGTLIVEVLPSSRGWLLVEADVDEEPTA